MDLGDAPAGSSSSSVTGTASSPAASDDVFADNGTRVIETLVRSLRANSFAERRAAVPAATGPPRAAR
jgi:hypothetical protein